MRASDLMTKDVLTLNPEMSVDEARELFFQHGIHGAPVVDHSGRLVGVVSVVDLATRRINRLPILRDGRLLGIVCASDIVRAFADLEKERAKECAAERAPNASGKI
jgi:CBS domain-containing protein